MNPIKSAKKAVVKVVLKRGASEALKRIDTPEERKALVAKAHIDGLPPLASWALATLASLLLEALSTTGFDLLIAGDANAWLRLLLQTFATKALLSIQEAQEVEADAEEAKDDDSAESAGNNR